MSMISLSASVFPHTTFNADVQEADALIFVDDASYEFVGGGMAANGL